MNDQVSIPPFKFEKQPIRITNIDGEPWFVAKDVAEALGYQWNGAQRVEHVPEEWKGVTSVVTPGGKQELITLSEQGLYFFLGRSDKPNALPFQKWIAGQVLPSIRKAGRYEMNHTPSIVDPFNARPDQALVNHFYAIQSATSILRASEASRLRMLGEVFKVHDIPRCILPDYTDEPLTKSLTELLKQHSSTLSAVKANTILVALGLLEEMTRPGTGGVVHKFKALTEEGQKYGKNMTSPQNERETQPHYFISTFPELLDRINAWLLDKAA